jgi:queuosine precursor transporter
MSKMKILTKGKHLWTRTIGSTVVGQFVDTLLVMTIIFAGSQTFTTIWKLILGGYFAKVAYEAVATPLTYWVVNTLKRAEGIEIFDEGVDFNPFKSEQRTPEV